MFFSAVFKHAFREMRGGLRGFFLYLGCLTLGVAAIAASGTVNEAVQAGIKSDARILLGADMQLSLTWRKAEPAELKEMETLGRVSHLSYLRTMIRGKKTALAEVKAVDDLYPLAGRLETTSAESLPVLLADKDGIYGGVADRALFVKLQIKPGDIIKIGRIQVQLRTDIKKEPDRTNAIAVFGSRLIISRKALDASGLIGPGSLYENRYNIELNKNYDFAQASAFLKHRHPHAEWKIKGLNDAASSMRRFFDDISSYLALLGLASLLVGGIGIANAVKAWMNSRINVIAILKCVGASESHLFWVSFIQIFILSCIGILLGICLGAFIGDSALFFLHEQVPFQLRSGIYFKPLCLSAAYGMLISIIFSLPSLSVLSQISPAMLMKRAELPHQNSPSTGYLMAVSAAIALLLALIIETTPRQLIAAGFIAGVIGSFLLFNSAAELIRIAARFILKKYRISSPAFRLGLSNLYRPNSMATAILLSIGMGLTALVTVTTAEQNISNQIENGLEDKAPSFYFTDIQKDQIGLFRNTVSFVPGNTLITDAPIARGRVSEIKGKPVVLSDIPAEIHWAVNSDRALTEMNRKPEWVSLKTGKWWSENDKGLVLVSVESKIANGLDLSVGDTLTFNIMGKFVTAVVANTRLVNWGSMQMNFAFIFSPGTFHDTPYMWIATVHSDSLDAEDKLQDVLAERLPNAAPARLREIISSASDIMQMTGKTVKWASVLGIIIGIMVLAGAMLAGQSRRIKEAVIFKVTGATRLDILKSYLAEFGILGFISAFIACFLGNLASYAVITGVMGLNWSFMAGTTAVVLVLCTCVTIGAGFIGTWQALGMNAASFLHRD